MGYEWPHRDHDQHDGDDELPSVRPHLEVRRQLLPRLVDCRRERLVARLAVQQLPHRRRRRAMLLPPLPYLLRRHAAVSDFNSRLQPRYRLYT